MEHRSSGVVRPGVASSPLNLFLTISPAYTVARVRSGQLTSAAAQTRTSICNGPGPILMPHGWRSFPATRAQCRVARRRATSGPMPKRTFYVPSHCLIVLTLFTWIVAIWASCDDDDSEGPHDVEKLEKSSDEHDHREAG